jgi:dynein heavy chain
LDPLLNKAIKKSGKNYQLELGGDPIDYDPNFKLFLMTKLFNPHFSLKLDVGVVWQHK